MNDIIVKAAGISKRFFVLQHEKTLLRLLKAMIKKYNFKKERWILRDISFDIKAGDSVALVGKNGAGKTTLLRIIAGIYEMTSGYIELKARPQLFFSYSVGFIRDLPIIDNIYLYGAVLGMDHKFLRPRIDAILHEAGLFDLRFSMLKDLSSGEIQRLALTIFFQAQSEFFIFDECLSYIDNTYRKKAGAYIKSLSRSNKTLILASHDIDMLRSYCDSAIWLENGTIRMSGDINTVLDSYSSQ